MRPARPPGPERSGAVPTVVAWTSPARRFLQWLRLIRLRDWAHFALLPMAAVRPDVALAERGWSLARGLALAFGVCSFAFLVNGVHDRGVDRTPQKNPFLEVPKDAMHTYERQLFWLVVTILILGATGPWAVLAAAAAATAIGWAYSAGPRLKRFPVVGTLANIGIFAPLLFLAANDVADCRHILSFLPPFVALLVQNQLLHEAADADDDRRGGVRTTFIAVGRGAAAAVVALAGIGVLAVPAWLTAAATRLPAWVVLSVPAVVFFPLAMGLGPRVPAAGTLRVLHRAYSILLGAVLFVWLRVSPA